METQKTSQLFEETNNVVNQPIFTVSAVAFDFDYATSDPSKSRADEIKVLVVKNKKPPRNSNEGKPGGRGLPTGQLESKEDMLQALKRETRDESGCTVKKIVGKLFVVRKRLRINEEIVPNEIHVFLVEASEAISRIREVEEIDGSVEPWISLREFFEMPLAQDKGYSRKNPDGIYFSHRQRLYWAMDYMFYGPNLDLELVKKSRLVYAEADETEIMQWLGSNRGALCSAMSDLAKDGLLDRFLPDENPSPEEEIPV